MTNVNIAKIFTSVSYVYHYNNFVPTSCSDLTVTLIWNLLIKVVWNLCSHAFEADWLGQILASLGSSWAAVGCSNLISLGFGSNTIVSIRLGVWFLFSQNSCLNTTFPAAIGILEGRCLTVVCVIADKGGCTNQTLFCTPKPHPRCWYWTNPTMDAQHPAAAPCFHQARAKSLSMGRGVGSSPALRC